MFCVGKGKLDTLSGLKDNKTKPTTLAGPHVSFHDCLNNVPKLFEICAEASCLRA
jgi:hypothetical protein